MYSYLNNLFASRIICGMRYCPEPKTYGKKSYCRRFCLQNLKTDKKVLQPQKISSMYIEIFVSNLIWSPYYYLQNLGNLKRPVHFLKVLVKDMWKTGFRLSLSQKLKICRHFKVWAKMAKIKKITITSKMVEIAQEKKFDG